MKKNKFVRIVLIVLSVMILIGVALIIYILSTVNNHNIIKVNIRDNATQVVEFQDLCLIPGEKCEYTISIGSDTSDKYKVELAFHEIAENTLKNYVHIKIETNEEIVCNQLLATLFDNNNITLFVDLTEDKKNDNSEFNNCTFNVTGDAYNIWTWGGKVVEFNNCTFNSDGKSILVYNQSCDVYVNGCTINDSTNGTGFTKSALETGVDAVGAATYNIYINNTTVNGFAENDKCVGYKNIVGNKNSISNAYLNIVVDGVDVY